MSSENDSIKDEINDLKKSMQKMIQLTTHLGNSVLKLCDGMEYINHQYCEIDNKFKKIKKLIDKPKVNHMMGKKVRFNIDDDDEDEDEIEDLTDEEELIEEPLDINDNNQSYIPESKEEAETMEFIRVHLGKSYIVKKQYFDVTHAIRIGQYRLLEPLMEIPLNNWNRLVLRMFIEITQDMTDLQCHKNEIPRFMFWLNKLYYYVNHRTIENEEVWMSKFFASTDIDDGFYIIISQFIDSHKW